MFSKYKKPSKPADVVLDAPDAANVTPIKAPAADAAAAPKASMRKASKPAAPVAEDKDLKRKKRMSDIKLELHRALLDNLNLAALEHATEQDLRQEINEISAEILSEKAIVLNREDRMTLNSELFDEVTGLGPLETLLKDETVNDILVNGPQQIFVERAGKLELTDITFKDEKHLLRIIDKIVSAVGRRVDESNPYVDARLQDGSRFNAMVPPIAVDGSLVSIRKFKKDKLGVDDLVQFGAFTEEMAAYLQAHYETGRFMGTAIVMQNGETVFAQSYGMASLEHQVPNTSQTKFRIGSITKQFTAAAILQLQDRGQLDVQAPISTYLPDYPQGDRLTIHHLLTHTAGIPNLTSFPDYLEWMQQPTTLAELMVRFQDLPLEFAPGEQHRYSNSGYVLLTQIIETVSGQTYADYLQTQLLQPLGLENTGYEQPLAVINHLAHGYQFTGEDYQQAAYINMVVPAGAGALYSTVDDLVRWHQFLVNADNRSSGILSDAAIAAMQHPHVALDAATPDASYGYGLMLGKQGFIA